MFLRVRFGGKNLHSAIKNCFKFLLSDEISHQFHNKYMSLIKAASMST